MKMNPALLFILITIIIDATGIGIIIPVLPSLVAETTNVPLDEAASSFKWILFSYAIMQFLFAPILGNLSDRYGRRPILLMSLFGLGVDYMFMFFAPTLVWLVIGRCIAGMFGASFTTAMAYIADVSTPENKTKNFGLIGAGFGIGFTIGPALGGLLGEFGLRIPFLFAGILSLINVIYGYYACKESLPPEKRRAFSWKRANPIGAIYQIGKYKELAGLFGVIFLYYLAGKAIHATWVLFTQGKFDWSIGDVGLSLTVVGVFIAIVQGGLAGTIVKKLGNVKMAFLGFFVMLFSLVGIGAAGSGWMLYLLMIPYAFTGLAGPAVQAMMSNNARDDEQGELQGMITLVMSVAEIIGPMVMVIAFEAFTTGISVNDRIYGMPYFLGAIFALLAIVILYLSTRKLIASQQRS